MNCIESHNKGVKVPYFASFDSFTGFSFGFHGGIYGGRSDGNIVPFLSIFTFSASSSLSLTYLGYSIGLFSCFFFVHYSFIIFFRGDFYCMHDDVCAGDVVGDISIDVVSNVAFMTLTKPFSLNIQINSPVMLQLQISTTPT